eukprot:COSAG05_NODE_975_length_6350_cov_6.983523_5_plen_179_part_00
MVHRALEGGTWRHPAALLRAPPLYSPLLPSPRSIPDAPCVPMGNPSALIIAWDPQVLFVCWSYSDTVVVRGAVAVLLCLPIYGVLAAKASAIYYCCRHTHSCFLVFPAFPHFFFHSFSHSLTLFTLLFGSLPLSLSSLFDVSLCYRHSCLRLCAHYCHYHRARTASPSESLPRWSALP